MKGIRILLVDDNPSARALLAAFVNNTPGLELCGEAGDGWQGLELTARLRPDLVLLDLIMPGLDGIGFLEGLGGLPGGGKPRVIILSGVSADAYVQHSCRLGADYYLVKPVDLHQLARRISALFPDGEHPEDSGPADFLLLRLGADSRLEGYGQLSYALELVSGCGRAMRMKEIYLSTAEASAPPPPAWRRTCAPSSGACMPGPAPTMSGSSARRTAQSPRTTAPFSAGRRRSWRKKSDRAPEGLERCLRALFLSYAAFPRID